MPATVVAMPVLSFGRAVTTFAHKIGGNHHHRSLLSYGRKKRNQTDCLSSICNNNQANRVKVKPNSQRQKSRTVFAAKAKTTTRMIDQVAERRASLFLEDTSDPTRLSWKEVKDGWGSWSEFMSSYRLRPRKNEDLKEALALSRLIKQGEA